MLAVVQEWVSGLNLSVHLIVSVNTSCSELVILYPLDPGQKNAKWYIWVFYGRICWTACWTVLRNVCGQMEWGWRVSAAPPGITPSENKATQICRTKDPRRTSKRNFILKSSYTKSLKQEPGCQNKKQWIKTTRIKKLLGRTGQIRKRKKKKKKTTQFEKTLATPTYAYFNLERWRWGDPPTPGSLSLHKFLSWKKKKTNCIIQE